ncbi:hypothetical protein KBD45_01025 [Candidatus Dojkabacteria bacterium]|nr:hypothetical protein [Candidatus Dojkabacteria bacterium]
MVKIFIDNFKIQYLLLVGLIISLLAIFIGSYFIYSDFRSKNFSNKSEDIIVDDSVKLEVYSEDFVAEGYVENADCNKINGWVRSVNEPNKSISVHIYERNSDGSQTFLVGVQANIHRPDVAVYAKDNGLHGFSISTPKNIQNGQVRNILVYAFDPVKKLGGGLLNNGSRVIQCSQLPKFSITIPNSTSFPIEVARPTKSSQYECMSDSSLFNSYKGEFLIAQKSNDRTSYCNVKSNIRKLQNVNCEGANVNLISEGLGFCYWNNMKQIKTYSNSNFMPNNGCSIHSNSYNRNNPGGYSSQFIDDFTKKTNYFTDSKYFLNSYNKLELSFGVRISNYSQSICPANILDPVTKTTDPVAQSMIGLMFTEIDPKTNLGLASVFYQLMLYDSREEYRTYEKGRNTDCKLSNSTSGGYPFILIDNSLAYYGQNYPKMNGEASYYNFNLLPQIIEGIRTCRSSQADLSKYRFTGFFLSTETMNTAGIETDFINPVFNIF